MIVIDASAVVSALLNDGPARQLMGQQRLHAPYLIDTEVASALRSPSAKPAHKREGRAHLNDDHEKRQKQTHGRASVEI